MSKYYLRQDAQSCIGCLACEVHCKTNKGLAPGPRLCQNLAVGPVALDGLPRLRFVFMPCFHCEVPACKNVCPSGAIKQRAEDGIVYIDQNLCIGCKSCITACPWGACQWNPAAGKAVKCDYCKDRVDKGLKPACVTKCLTGCLDFGLATEVKDDRRERFAQMVANPWMRPGDVA
ncbi:MAG: 4Fe-4S dicluster domain-containing protein [Deltaproteobacteria bacterium]|nr:4Fe-4S dicluster domain-containing protein [Deltaproteobacteria bacterium]